MFDDDHVGDDHLVARWRALASRYATASCALERELQDRHGIGMSEFEVIDRLAGATDNRLRVQELADLVHLSQSALSRAVSRLERDGLVRRLICEQDRRGVFVTLTDPGRRRHERARPTQRAVLAANLGEPPAQPPGAPAGVTADGSAADGPAGARLAGAGAHTAPVSG